MIADNSTKYAIQIIHTEINGKLAQNRTYSTLPQNRDSSIIETPYDQGKADENRDDDSYSVDTFFRDEHQEKVITYSLHLGSSSIMVIDSTLSNFSAKVIHDMPVLGLTMTQQSMDFPSDLWANMDHT